MTAKECNRIAWAYDMMADWVGVRLVWWPDDSGDENFCLSACILQQLIAEYEEWT